MTTKEIAVINGETVNLPDCHQRDLAAIEITALHDEVMACAKIGLEKAIRIGELLTERKAALKHGQFTAWITGNLPFTDRTARNYMQLYEKRELLKTETVSVLTEGYKLISAGGSNMPIDEFNAAREALLILNGVDLFDESFSVYTHRAEVSSRLFFDAVNEYLEAEDIDIKEITWGERRLLALQNLWAEHRIKNDRIYAGVIADLEEDWGVKCNGDRQAELALLESVREACKTKLAEFKAYQASLITR